MIKRKGNIFYMEVFYPKQDYKFMGKAIMVNDKKIFVLHFKIPEKHFYIKGLGYPINEELLKMLNNAGITHILIPEDGKTGFRVHLAEVNDYLHGDVVKEPHTETQRCIPLQSLKELNNITREKLQILLYH